MHAARLQITPKNLLAAMWLQFAQAVTGDKEYRQCKQCGKPFEISLAPEGMRKSREYCTDPCRFKAYRERQGKARRLDSEGVAVKEIAKRLGSTTATIKKWIKQGGHKDNAKKR